MRISDWSSDVCSSDLRYRRWSARTQVRVGHQHPEGRHFPVSWRADVFLRQPHANRDLARRMDLSGDARQLWFGLADQGSRVSRSRLAEARDLGRGAGRRIWPGHVLERSEEHTSELQSLMRISYAVFCLKKTK